VSAAWAAGGVMRGASRLARKGCVTQFAHVGSPVRRPWPGSLVPGVYPRKTPLAMAVDCQD
jgi:hypothetical protein